jgi:dsDNA-specific endonuclease/ATPase MutS2
MFTNHLPKLDLHGEISDTAPTYIESFINEHHMLGTKKVVIVHGIGAGILKKVVHEVLSKNKKVLSYKLDMFNIGCTVVELKC